MANSFSSPPTLPDQSLTLNGEVLRAQTFDAIVETLDWAHAEGPTAPMVSQEWPEGQCSWADSAGSGAVAEVAQWRIPTVSPAHQTLIVSTLCSQSNDPAEGGTIATFEINGDSGTISPDFGASTYKHLELTYGQPVAGYADLTMGLASPNGSLTLEDVTARFERLPSPLDAGPAGGVVGAFTPMGRGRAAADMPAASRRGAKIIHNAGVLLDYPRSVFCWSALRGIQGWSNADGAEEYAAQFPRRCVVQVRPRLIAAGGEYTVWVRVVPHATDITEVHIFAGGSLVGPGVTWGPGRPCVADIYVSADPAQVPVWRSSTIVLPEERFLALPWLTVALGFVPGPDPGVGAGYHGVTTAQVIGLSIWGS